MYIHAYVYACIHNIYNIYIYIYMYIYIYVCMYLYSIYIQYRYVKHFIDLIHGRITQIAILLIIMI